eukprot:COSAG05_NODE_9284_length_634_cov_12.742156_1_plen_37_part_10
MVNPSHIAIQESTLQKDRNPAILVARKVAREVGTSSS